MHYWDSCYMKCCIMGSLIFKGTACGLYSEDHANRDFPLIFHRYRINLFNGSHDTSHLEHTAQGIYREYTINPSWACSK